MGQLFKWFGYNVGGHWNEEHGMAHDFPPSVRPELWPLTKAKRYYQYLIQVVRNPVDVVESAYLWKTMSLADQTNTKIQLDGRNKLENTIQSVVLWNRAIEAADPDLVVQVEHAPSTCSGWLESKGFALTESEEDPPGKVNARTEDDWERKDVDWSQADKNTMDMLKQHCSRYGYRWL
jgi:hypothetical protein